MTFAQGNIQSKKKIKNLEHTGCQHKKIQYLMSIIITLKIKTFGGCHRANKHLSLKAKRNRK